MNSRTWDALSAATETAGRTAVHSFVLLEAAHTDVPSGALLPDVIGPAIQLYQPGEKEEAADRFVRWAAGQGYRTSLDRLIPGAYAQLVTDADACFADELPGLQEWHLTRDQAGRITQLVLAIHGAESAVDWPAWPEVLERLQRWISQTESVVLAGANHALQEMDSRGVAEAMAPFLARPHHVKPLEQARALGRLKRTCMKQHGTDYPALLYNASAARSGAPIG